MRELVVINRVLVYRSMQPNAAMNMAQEIYISEIQYNSIGIETGQCKSNYLDRYLWYANTVAIVILSLKYVSLT